MITRWPLAIDIDLAMWIMYKYLEKIIYFLELSCESSLEHQHVHKTIILTNRPCWSAQISRRTSFRSHRQRSSRCVTNRRKFRADHCPIIEAAHLAFRPECMFQDFRTHPNRIVVRIKNPCLYLEWRDRLFTLPYWRGHLQFPVGSLLCSNLSGCNWQYSDEWVWPSVWFVGRNSWTCRPEKKITWNFWRLWIKKGPWHWNITELKSKK